MDRPTPDRIALGRALRAFRLRTGMSQEALGVKAGLHRTYIGMVERGERNASFESIERMLHALRVTWTQFGADLDQTAREADGSAPPG